MKYLILIALGLNGCIYEHCSTKIGTVDDFTTVQLGWCTKVKDEK